MTNCAHFCAACKTDAVQRAELSNPAAVDAARAEGYERGKANEHRRFRAVVDKALNDFAEGEWQDAFLVHDVDDDVSAVQATEAWFRDRLNIPTAMDGAP